MASKYQHEVDAIEAIREANRFVGQYILAKRIKKREFPVPCYGSNDIGIRSVLSIYSVIRRYDARVKKAVSNAVAAV